jgi:hypothetical protein
MFLMERHVTQTQLPNLYYYRPTPRASSPQTVEADICIYGGTSAGVSAAVAARRKGKRVALLEFGEHVGGLSSGGLGATDIGNKAAIGGISRDFYKRLGKHYGHEEMWTFEPGVAEQTFLTMLKEAGVSAEFNKHLVKVHKNGTQGGGITAIEMEDGSVYKAKMFIDATYEGDLLAMAGVSYHVGREANAVYKETLNGVHFGHPNHNFKAFIDPYVEEGNPRSGLLPLVQDEKPGVQGDGDKCIQAYNFRMCLSLEPSNRKPFPKPANYDAKRYELLRRYINAWQFDSMRLSIAMPNGKSDTNNYGAIASDHIGANYRWPEAGYEEREAIFQDHVSYTAGLFYFLQNDARLPKHVLDYMAKWGLPKDEFTGTGGFPHQLYVREARRMISSLVMTEHECRGLRIHENSVGLAAYNMDAHNARRVVVGGRVINEGNVEVAPERPYPIAYEAIVPKQEECTNLLVPVCLSSSHIAYGSIRMEPVFMVLGESAAIAATLALEQGISAVQKLPYAGLKKALVEAGQILSWPDAVDPRKTVSARM